MYGNLGPCMVVSSLSKRPSVEILSQPLLLFKPKAITPGLANHQHWRRKWSHQSTTKMAPLISSSVDGFPFPTVHPIIGEPNYKPIAALHFQLNANAASVQSHPGNEVLGLLHLTVSPAVYATLWVAPFVPPPIPGPSPTIPAAATGSQINNLRATFQEEATERFKQYTTTNRALKQLLVGAVDNIIHSLQTKYLGYLNVSTLQILDHLYSQYARISCPRTCRTTISPSRHHTIPTYQSRPFSNKSKMVSTTLLLASRPPTLPSKSPTTHPSSYIRECDIPL